MKPAAIEKAKGRIRVAQLHLSMAADANSDQEFDDAWFVFLTAWKGVYTVLEQGAKGSPSSMQWFGGRKAERKRTPYLQYLFIARNDEEHGLGKSISQGRQGSLKLVPPTNPDGQTRVRYTWEHDPTGRSGRIELVSEIRGSLLSDVKDREGRKVEPPWVLVEGRYVYAPLDIGEMALEYASSMVAEAEILAASNPPSP
ncbi:MAG: hypothetical protein ACT6TH_14615 [Brevundimonas sp.]|uniref:hypothetical protein n=1 Tax=Brevundimonas sp. TaxID=1871086 RepID=UPI004033BAA2